MIGIDLEGLIRELQQSGTDERLVRALVAFGRHVNGTFEELQATFRDRVEDVISEDRQRRYERSQYD